MIKQSILAALAVTAALAIPAIAQQIAPSDTPAASQVQQRPDAEDSDRDDRGSRRWQREYRRGEAYGDERGERRDRRSYDDRDRMGPREGMMRHHGMARFCGPQGGRFAERRLDRIERATRPTAEQKAAFDALKDASNKAADIIKAACPAETSVTPPGRLAAAEKRLTAMLEAIRTVRPAMEAYYNALSDEQKARLYLSRRAMEPMGERDGEWRGRERGEPRGGLRDRERDGYRERRFDRRGHDEDSSPERL
jgi:LTXXQ motif family protein